MPVRAVIDTNVIVSALLSQRGIPDAIIRELRRDRFRLVISAEVVDEYEAVLSRPRLARRFNLTGRETADFLRVLMLRADMVQPSRVLPLVVRDVKDRHLLLAAIEGKADFIVSGDDDLQSLAGDPRLGGLQIVSPRAFLLMLRE